MVIIYPTESSYAIGCAFNDAAGIKQIMQLKGRRDPKFTVIASSLQQVKEFFKLPAYTERLMKQVWPGAVSIVVSPKYAIRVPDYDVPRKLAKKIGAPIIATSLNISGQPPIFDLKNLPPVFSAISAINVGPLPKRKPSTILQPFNGGHIVIRA